MLSALQRTMGSHGDACWGHTLLHTAQIAMQQQAASQAQQCMRGQAGGGADLGGGFKQAARASGVL